jgi:hypothetical protein
VVILFLVTLWLGPCSVGHGDRAFENFSEPSQRVSVHAVDLQKSLQHKVEVGCPLGYGEVSDPG